MNETLPRHWLGARKGIERLRTKDQDSHRCTHNTTHNLLLSCPFASLFLLAPKYQSTMSAKPEVDTKMKTADSAEKTNQEGDEAQKLALEALEGRYARGLARIVADTKRQQIYTGELPSLARLGCPLLSRSFLVTGWSVCIWFPHDSFSLICHTQKTMNLKNLIQRIGTRMPWKKKYNNSGWKIGMMTWPMRVISYPVYVKNYKRMANKKRNKQ